MYQVKNFAATYDEGAYGACAYSEGCTVGVNPDANNGGTGTTQDTGILAPLTGFVRDQPTYVLSGLILFAIIFAALVVRLVFSYIKKR